MLYSPPQRPPLSSLTQHPPTFSLPAIPPSTLKSRLPNHPLALHPQTLHNLFILAPARSVKSAPSPSLQSPTTTKTLSQLDKPHLTPRKGKSENSPLPRPLPIHLPKRHKIPPAPLHRPLIHGTKQRRPRSIRYGYRTGQNPPPHRGTNEGAKERGVGGLQVCFDDAGVEGVGGYSQVTETIVEGAGVQDGAEFGVGVAFPGCERGS